MKTIFTIIIVVFTTNIFSQSFKTYSGEYEGGTAIYQYTENQDYQRIFDGPFTYTANLNFIRNRNIGMEGNDFIITGQFKNNLKTGIWNYKIKEYLESKKSNYISNTIKGQFENGFKTGIWNYVTKKVIDSKSTESTINFSFNKSILVGKVQIGERVDGNIDNNGNFIGPWNIKYDGKEYIAEFINGVFIKLIVRIIENGDIVFKYSVTDFYTSDLDSLKFNEKIKNASLYLLPCETYKSSEYAYGNKFIDINDNNKETTMYSLRYFNSFGELVSTLPQYDDKVNTIKQGAEPFKIITPKVIIYSQWYANNLAYQKAEENKLKNIKQLIKSGDSLAENKQFVAAISEYERAYKLNASDELHKKKLALFTDACSELLPSINEQIDKREYESALQKIEIANKYCKRDSYKHTSTELKKFIQEEYHIKYSHEDITKKITESENKKNQEIYFFYNEIYNSIMLGPLPANYLSKLTLLDEIQKKMIYVYVGKNNKSLLNKLKETQSIEDRKQIFLNHDFSK